MVGSGSKKDHTNTNGHYSSGVVARQLIIIGNVSVGKTSLFAELCANGEKPVNIPGSTQQTRRGVLALGPAGLSWAGRRHCQRCTNGGWRKQETPSCLSADPADSRTGDTSARACPATNRVIHLYDTPGSATLAANSEDEMVARDLLLSGQMDGVVLVADAKNIRRSLALALEINTLGLPMVIALNMLDEAETMGIEIDEQALSDAFGVPVGRTVAIERRGIHRLAELMLEARVSPLEIELPKGVAEALDRLTPLLLDGPIAPRGLALLLLADDPAAMALAERHFNSDDITQITEIIKETRESHHTSLKQLLVDTFYGQADQIVERVAESSARSPSPLVRFGQLAQQPLSGSLIGLAVMVLAYFWIGKFGATFLVDAVSATFFEQTVIPLCQTAVDQLPSQFVRDAIMDPDFGLLPTGLFLAVGLVLPVLFCFFSLQAVLEDSGYLPRLAVLFDRLFSRIGLNGQALIPLVLGFSCIAMSIITTRMLPSKKERNILSLLVIGIPCAPLIAVFVVILGELPWTATALLCGLIGLRIMLTGWVTAKALPSPHPDLILEIPQMRIPRLRILWSKTWRRTFAFIREAVPIFLLAAFVVFVFDRIGGLEVIERVARPAVNGLLGLPDQAVQVFIKTAIRRESGAAELGHLRDQFDNVQLVVTMLVMTFVMPCLNTAIVLLKERGVKACLVILSVSFVLAIASGALVNLVCRLTGVTFA